MGKLVDNDANKQIVTFIFDGNLDPAQVAEWNKQIKQLKEKFGNKVKSATVRAQNKLSKPTPSSRPRGKKK